MEELEDREILQETLEVEEVLLLVRMERVV